MDNNFLTMLDEQFRPYAPRVVDDVKIARDAANALATTISREIGSSNNETLVNAIRQSSPLSVKRRLFFFEDYMIWRAEIERNLRCPESKMRQERLNQSFATFSLVLPHLYMSFVFAGDGLFEVLSKQAPNDSNVRKCAKYIRNNPLRAFRNAVAHGNWYLTYTGAVKYWAQKDAARMEAFAEFEATADDMLFYLAFTRCVAWTSLLAAAEAAGEAEGGICNV